MSALSYMQRRVSGTYELRRRLPTKLAGKPVPPHMRERFPELVNPKTGLFKHELVRTLSTKEPGSAKRRIHEEAQRVCALFDDALASLAAGPVAFNVTDADLAEIVREVMAELLGADEQEREDGDDRRLLQTEEDRNRWPDLVPAVPLVPGATAPTLPAPSVKGMTEDHHHAYGLMLEELEQDFRNAYARRDPSIVNAETRIALKRREWSLDPTAPHYRKVGMAVLEGHVRAYDVMRRKQAGDVLPSIQLAPPPSGQPNGASAPASVSVELGPKLSEAFVAWKVGGSAKGARKPRANTALEADQAVRYFKELHGDLRLGEITREKTLVAIISVNVVVTRVTYATLGLGGN
jgi:hypothetical protein